MLHLSYSRPVSRDNLPALAASFYRHREKIRRRRILSAVCDRLCFLLHTGLMIVTSVGLLHRFGGQEFAAVLDSLPCVPQVLNACFQKVPQLLRLPKMGMPELLGAPAAILLPPLVCMLAAALLRICLGIGRKAPAVPRDLSPEGLLDEVRTLQERSGKSRKANWAHRSSFLSLVVFAASLIYCIYVVRPESEDLDVKYIMTYVFIALIAFSQFYVLAILTDIFLEMFCGLDAQWDGTRLIEDLEAFIEKEAANAAPEETAPPAAEAAPPAQEAAPAQEIGPAEGDAP